MPRVCMLASQDHATHPIIRRQLVTLRAAGFDLTVVDPTVCRPVSLHGLARLVWRVLRRIDERRFGEPWWTAIHFLQVFLTGLRFAVVASTKKADVYHAHDLESLLPALVVGKLRRRTVVYDAHELTSEQGDPRSLRKRVERALERILVPLADYLVTPNQPRARVYASRCNLRNPPIIVRNCPPAQDVARTDLIRRELGLSARTRIVVYHGALIDGRGLDNLVRSARHFDDDIALVMIGEQTEYFHTVLEPIAHSSDGRRQVHFIPFVEPDRILDYVASADLGVVIYKNINLNNYLCAPTKLYEYLMVRLPVVVSGFPEMLELLEQFPVGRSFDPENPSAIAAAVNEFFRSQGQSRAAVEAALDRSRSCFTWEKESQKLVALFRRAPRELVSVA